VVTDRKRRAEPIRVVVPTAIRVEAGWDRTAPDGAFPNHLRIADVSPRPPFKPTGVSVADAHLGSVADSASDDHVTIRAWRDYFDLAQFSSLFSAFRGNAPSP
jgi:hypothetical protein